VPSRVVKERVRELLEVSGRKWRSYLAAQVGRELEVVVERRAGGLARGTAGNYVTVRWPPSQERRGEAARVRVVGADGEECVGVRA
jgi:tRNA A37 methylthiotransferase MiaB